MFIDFLERQNFRNEVKEARMEKLRETVDPTFVPSLCDRSRRLAVAAKVRVWPKKCRPNIIFSTRLTCVFR